MFPKASSARLGKMHYPNALKLNILTVADVLPHLLLRIQNCGQNTQNSDFNNAHFK